MAITSLLHVAGFITGLALYGMLLALAVRERMVRDSPASGRTLLVAVLGLIWNLGALLGHASDWRTVPGLVVVIAYAALGLLPAVFIDALMASGRATFRPSRLTCAAAYGLAIVAAALHLVGWHTGAGLPSGLAMRLVGWGFLPFGAAILFLPPARRASAGMVWAFALTAFAASALHLAAHPAEPDTWPKAVFGHHASVPLAFAILYQDYRFALADLFLKRALSLVVVATGVTAFSSLLARAEAPALSPDVAFALVVAGVGTALAFPAGQWGLRLGRGSAGAATPGLRGPLRPDRPGAPARGRAQGPARPGGIGRGACRRRDERPVVGRARDRPSGSRPRRRRCAPPCT